MEGAPSPEQFWAKLRYKSEERRPENIVAWHSLVAHAADVAAVVEALLQRTILRKRLARLIGWDDLTEVHVARLAVLAALHDAGKANHGFQDQAFDAHEYSPGHVRPIVEIFSADEPGTWLEPLGIGEMVGWFVSEEVFAHFLLATWAHHGRPVLPEGDFRADYWRPNVRRDPRAAWRRLAELVRRWFPAAFTDGVDPFPAAPPLQHAFNGLLTLADWIGSDTRFFPYAEETEDPMFPIERAREGARRALQSLFLDAAGGRQALGDEPVGFRGVIEAGTPYPIQQACYDLPVHPQGSLTILESDTGSGKTEAAVARFLRLYQEGLVDGMYFALPTRSAASQIHRRITEIVVRVFPEGHRPPVVLAVPGYLRVDEAEAVRLPDFRVLWDDEALHYRGWAAEHPKRYLAGPIVVGTIDQVLLAGLQVSHAHMRAAALLRHFLVVDEVHASDAYMTALLERVLAFHLATGGHALLMSATLGSVARVRYATKGGTPPPLDEAERERYPLLTHVDAGRQNPERISAASSGREKPVTIRIASIASDPQAVAERALQHARAGARVLIIRNRVDDCLAVQQALEKAAGDDRSLLLSCNGQPVPHHGRYAPEDRRALDAAIEAAFGKNSPGRGIVAACTQTVEQSLDIDADLLITDLCPIDVLLQRIGRLHRHVRPRPKGYEQAVCLVLTPAERDLTETILADGRARGLHGLGTVYPDLRVIEATWRVLEKRNQWQIPCDNRRLVECATHPAVLQQIVREKGERWEAHQRHVLGQEAADRYVPEITGLHFDRPFGEHPFGKDIAPRTRLDEDDYRVELPEPVPGPFGWPVGTLPVASWMIGDELPEDPKALDVTPFDGGFSFVFAGRWFHYDRLGLRLA